MKEFLRKGQISLFAAMVGAAGMIGASIITRWATTNSRVFGVESKVNIIQEREAYHFLELSRSIEKLDKKLDLILEIKTKK